MEYGLIQCLKSDGVEMDFDHHYFSFKLSLEFLNNKLNINQIIFKNNDGSQTRLAPDTEIKVKWKRDKCILFVSYFKYININSHRVNSEL